MKEKKAQKATGKINRKGETRLMNQSESGEYRIDYINVLRMESGTIINGRYEIVRKIGKGGFGIVFEAIDLTLKTRLALKFFDPEMTRNEKKLYRVKREINIARKITDDRIVKIFSLEKWNNIYFMVMELVEGKSLEVFLKEKKILHWGEFKDIFLEILEAVSVLHRNEIIHRDIKPSNIILTRENKIKILDFSLSKEISDREMTSSIGEIVGSVHYISPEQIQPQRSDIDFRSDIYQLGIILYRALSGIHPFEDSNTMEMLLKHLQEKPAKISLGEGKLPKFIEFGMGKALEKKRELRFGSIGEMLIFFKKEKIPPVKERAMRLLRRPVRMVVFLSLLVISISTALFYYYAKADKTLHSIEVKENNRLIVKNAWGFRVWEKKNFSPFVIYDTSVIKNIKNICRGIPQKIIGTDAIWVAINHSNPTTDLSTDSSILEDAFSARLHFYGSHGEHLEREPDLYQVYKKVFEFAPRFEFEKFLTENIDHDGKSETTAIVGESFMMYPHIFILIEGACVRLITNPGVISTYEIVESTPDSSTFLFFGANNLVAHCNFVSEVKFDNNPPRNCIYGIPNLSQSSLDDMDGFLIFLPSESMIKKSEWKKKGQLIILDKISGNWLAVYKEGRLSVKSSSGEKEYNDEPEKLRQIYLHLNNCYQQKVLYRNYQKALNEIENALEYQPENPYLLSALLYFKGDMEIAQRLYKEGEKTLEEAIHYNPYNTDAAQRWCESKFLQGEIRTAIQASQSRFERLPKFWGLIYGKKLFEMYCYLQSGEFFKAEEIVDRSTFLVEANKGVLSAILSVCKGNYGEAFNQIEKVKGPQISPFTLTEYRLLYARILFLLGKDFNKMEFFFNDIRINSVTRGHLAKISYGYCLAHKEGRKEDAAIMVKESFAELWQRSKGDFETSLWFFYDAYVYGKTMEETGDKKEAVRGYQACIKANSHTGLAKVAEQALKKLAKMK
jgi:serine/threonine protein kinase